MAPSNNTSKKSKPKNPFQELSQTVCQRYGWSLEVVQKPDSGLWVFTIQIGLEKVDFAEGHLVKETLAQLVLDRLKETIEKEESKPVREMVDVVKQKIPIYESTEENWAYVWDHKPRVVGIDTEGNLVAPPILVQIAFEDYVILEVPINGSISIHLQRLLDDDSITKVFCDNYSHKDKKCLGLPCDDKSREWDAPPFVDLESLGKKCFGRVKVPRGLGGIINLLGLYPDVRIGKPRVEGTTHRKHVGRFSWMEQGKAPRITSVHQLSNDERFYAAVDAVCTLQAYEAFQSLEQSHSLSNETTREAVQA